MPEQFAATITITPDCDEPVTTADVRNWLVEQFAGCDLGEVQIGDIVPEQVDTPPCDNEVWCIQHRKGWCATAYNRKPDPIALKDETRCGHVVLLRTGDMKRTPTCPECLKKVHQAAQHQRRMRR